jgi:hypothetical protein
MPKVCKVDGCARIATSLGWCGGHYLRARRSGVWDPGPAEFPPPYKIGIKDRVERFWFQVEKRGPDDCWYWQGAVREGYGRFYDDWDDRSKPRPQRGTHVVAFELAYGWYPRKGSGQEIRHLCGHRLCVNVAHLAAGTAQENAQDRYRHGDRVYKLSFEQAQEIRARIAAGEVANRLAEEFGVCSATISAIKYGKVHKPPS